MTPSCLAIRETLLELRGVVPPADGELSAHLLGCGECADFARRLTAVALSLSGLPRRSVPPELDGLAVAAMQAGQRQSRAAEAVHSLPRLSAPGELSDRVLDPQLRVARAPSELDRLVEEDLRKQGAASARRFAGGAERRKARQVLRDRPERRGTILRRRPAVRRALLAAAGLVLIFAAGSVWLRGLDRGFEVHYEPSLNSMDPMARSLLSGLSGGLVDAREKRL